MLGVQTKDVINSQRTGQPIKDQRLAKLLEEAKPTSGPPADFSAKVRLCDHPDSGWDAERHIMMAMGPQVLLSRTDPVPMMSPIQYEPQSRSVC